MRRRLKITLILAASEKDALAKKSPFTPLSLPILAALAPDHDYELIDMLHEHDRIDFDSDSEIVGISFRQSAEESAKYLAEKFRARGKYVIVGGAQASAKPIESKEFADTVVVGEAENLWAKFLEDFMDGHPYDFYVCSPSNFKPEGYTVHHCDALPDLQNLPVPARHLLKKKYVFDVTYASRGCPIGCDFCLVSDIYGRKLRFRPADNVVSEISKFKGFYYLLDDTVFGRANCYDYYIELYKKIARLPKKNYWTGQANLDAATTDKGREVIRMAAKSGLIYAAVGLESINISTLKSSGAYSKMGVDDSASALEKIKENIRFIQNQGIIVSGWFAIGYETDTVQTYYDSLAFCEEMDILPVFSPVRALPGSRLWKRLKEENKLQPLDHHITNIKINHLDEKQVVKAMIETGRMGYSFKAHYKRLKYFFKLFRHTENNLNDAIYKTIFAAITQYRMGKIVLEECEILDERIRNT